MAPRRPKQAPGVGDGTAPWGKIHRPRAADDQQGMLVLRKKSPQSSPTSIPAQRAGQRAEYEGGVAWLGGNVDTTAHVCGHRGEGAFAYIDCHG
jgi:hypothetical protein